MEFLMLDWYDVAFDMDLEYLGTHPYTISV